MTYDYQRLVLRLGLGVAASGLIGFLAYRRKSLSKSGVLGAVIVGTAIFGFGGWTWGLLLIVFFVFSSLLSHYKEAAKAKVADKFAKGHQRDLGQALANGGMGALLALLSQIYPHPAVLAAFAGAMATVNADTWATELGVLSRRPPRLITTWRSVAPGTSGGVSGLGTAATVAGALAIGLAAAGFTALDGLWRGGQPASVGAASAWGGLWLLPAGTLGGLVGSLFDSFLGATVQAMYYSPARHKETERRADADGSPNLHVRGWRWLGNDAVNLASSLVGALAAALTWLVLH